MAKMKWIELVKQWGARLRPQSSKKTNQKKSVPEISEEVANAMSSRVQLDAERHRKR